MESKCLASTSLEMATEKATRPRCNSGVSGAARQISSMRCGSFSDLRRERAALVFSVEESGERIDEKNRQRWDEIGRRRERKAMEARERPQIGTQRLGLWRLEREATQVIFSIRSREKQSIPSARFFQKPKKSQDL